MRVTQECIHFCGRIRSIGPLYLQTDLITPTESYGGFEPGGVSNVAILARSKCKTPKYILPHRNGVVRCVEITMLIALTVRKL